MSGPPSSSRSTAPRIKNRAPAAVQISAEQILREAHDRQEQPLQQTKTRIEDHEELEEYRGRKRKEYEETIRRTRNNMSAWMKYATWEASQGEMARSRSVFERALDVEPANVALWLRYTDTELKNRNIQHARNLYDRAVSILPRVDTLWYKYVHLEELLGNISGARQVFERWMTWEPDEKAWSAYTNFEVRYEEFEKASSIWERSVTCHPDARQWIKWSKFEQDRGAYDSARRVFTMALEFFGEDEDRMEKAQTVYTAFAKMETRLKEFDRARVIYKYALERLPRSKSSGIYSSYSRFEKQYGNKQGVEDTVLGKRRIQYEEEITAQQGTGNYDTWFDYTRLEEDAYRSLDSSSTEGTRALARVREVYERAVSNVPPSQEKRHWRRYIFLWLNYALFEELDSGDISRAREIYRAAIALVPHRTFTFSKLWLQYAHFEIRQLDLTSARKILGASIGLSAKDSLFQGYIDLELSLKEFDRARKLYERALEWDSSNSRTWLRFAELEKNLFDLERARSIYELGISSDLQQVDMPEVIWKAYIDFELEEEEYDRANALFERLLEKSGHVKVWISYALSQLHSSSEDEDEEREESNESARKIFSRGYNALKSNSSTQGKEDRVVLLESWKSFESSHGDHASLSEVESKMPRVVKKRRTVGQEEEEEYYDLLFPDDEDSTKGGKSFKLLAMAHAWRQKQQQQQQQQQPEQEQGSEQEEEEQGTLDDSMRDG